MLFQSWNFWIFLAVLLPVYHLTRRTRLRIPLLLLASYVFYGCFDWRSPVWLVIITLSDYLISRAIASVRRNGAKKALLWLSVVINLGILGTFKYLNFALDNLQQLFDALHIEAELPETDWLLPIGLSFFTFKSLAHTCDVYFGKIKPERNFLRYACFTAFFPQIVAGPIERSRTLLPQLRHALPCGWDDIAAGLSLLVTGFFKKLVLADTLSAYIEPLYADPSSTGGASLLCASIAFSWQIYFDFSGYSDMARGVARLMGFRTPLNFNHPYVSTDVQDFWRRWHITLSLWFRDYVYIPLGGNRVAAWRVWLNVMITMLLSGLWHGAAWTFVVWGGLNGIGSVFASRTAKSRWFNAIPLAVRQILCFAFINLTWIFFRAPSFDDALTIIRRICLWSAGDFRFPVIPACAIAAVWIYQLLWSSRWKRLTEYRPVRIAAFVLMIGLLLLLGGGANSQFIYQQF